MPEVILAYSMNGEALSHSHGFPLRAVVPGWYGMAPVKWLTRIVVTDTAFRGYFQTSDYNMREVAVKGKIFRQRFGKMATLTLDWLTEPSRVGLRVNSQGSDFRRASPALGPQFEKSFYEYMDMRRQPENHNFGSLLMLAVIGSARAVPHARLRAALLR